ncbi:MAG: ATP-binding protein, partial [Planctomycetales bacterium]
QDLMTHQISELFESRFLGKQVRWSGELKRAGTFTYDLVFGDTKGTKAVFDREQVRRCLINLVANACHALEEKKESTEDSRIMITAAVDDDEFRVSVADNGPGIDSKQLEKIFEPLFSTKTFGVGLGLPIVQEIIRRHGGKVTVVSEVGSGATITMQLPIDPNLPTNG